MDNQYIEQKARELQTQIWKERAKLWPSNVPEPARMLSPHVAAQVLGVRFEEVDDLGRFGHQGNHFEVAGTFDRSKNVISVSRKFPVPVMRFTAAHEVGHWLLHPIERAHRDRPIKELSPYKVTRDPLEREADYFAACYLIPRGLLTKAMQDAFQIKGQFAFDETTAYRFAPDDPDSLLYPVRGSLDRELALAVTEGYLGRRFNSLAKQFGVSPTTIAIRLKELNLVAA